METDGEARARRLAEAISRGDAEAAVAECHPQVEYNSMLATLEGKPFEGHAGIRRYFREVVDTFDEWTVEVHEVREGPDGRVVISLTMHARGRHGGPALLESMAHIWQLRDGKLFRSSVYREPVEAFAEVGLRPKR